LEIGIGLALLALTLYTSTLSFALRTYSRSRLVERLSEDQQRVWLERLDRHEAEFQGLASFLRLLSVLACAVFVYARFVGFQQPLATSAEPLVWATLTCVLLLLFIAIAIPTSLAIHAGEPILARSLWLLWPLSRAFYPLQKTFQVVDFVVRRLLGKSDTSQEDQSERVEKEILEAVSEGELHGAFDEEQKEMIESVLELHETTVNEIMTPRTDIVALPVDANAEQVQQTIRNAGHSRIPVYEESLDRIIGVLYAKDLIGLDLHNGLDLRRLMRSVPYVPETKTIDRLLREFRQQRVHIAIVLDEYGGTAGLVTIEDILEELVGEIDDEYDRGAPPQMRRIDADTLEVDARVHVHEVNEELSIALPDNGDYETIGGFVFTVLGKIPSRGEQVTHGNVRISVLDAEPRRINRLRIHVDRQQTAD